MYKALSLSLGSDLFFYLSIYIYIRMHLNSQLQVIHVSMDINKADSPLCQYGNGTPDVGLQISGARACIYIACIYSQGSIMP